MNTITVAATNEETGIESGTTLRSPGSHGEHLLQSAYNTAERAGRFYRDQLCTRLLPPMVEFVGRMEMTFVATADERGECDATLRAGPAGFVQVLDEGHLAYPEYRGNGVLASLGNISENPHVGLLMVDFVRDLIAYVHCRNHIPQMMPVPQQRAWGTDDVRRKGGDYFGATVDGLPAQRRSASTPTAWLRTETSPLMAASRVCVSR